MIVPDALTEFTRASLRERLSGGLICRLVASFSFTRKTRLSERVLRHFSYAQQQGAVMVAGAGSQE